MKTELLGKWFYIIVPIARPGGRYGNCTSRISLLFEKKTDWTLTTLQKKLFHIGFSAAGISRLRAAGKVFSCNSYPAADLALK